MIKSLLFNKPTSSKHTENKRERSIKWDAETIDFEEIKKEKNDLS